MNIDPYKVVRDKIPMQCLVKKESGEVVKGRIVGRFLSLPRVVTEDNLSSEVSWELAKKVSLGQVKVVNL